MIIYIGITRYHTGYRNHIIRLAEYIRNTQMADSVMKFLFAQRKGKLQPWQWKFPNSSLYAPKHQQCGFINLSTRVRPIQGALSSEYCEIEYMEVWEWTSQLLYTTSFPEVWSVGCTLFCETFLDDCHCCSVEYYIESSIVCIHFRRQLCSMNYQLFKSIIHINCVIENRNVLRHDSLWYFWFSKAIPTAKWGYSQEHLLHREIKDHIHSWELSYSYIPKR